MGIFTEVYESNQNIVNNIGQDKYKVGGNQLAKAWDDAQKLVDVIDKSTQQQETLRILLEQKKIADEIRIKIEKENIFLRNERVRLKNDILVERKINQENKKQKKDIKFLEMNLYYGHKCRKTVFRNLYMVGTEKYRECVLNKGPKK